MPHPSVPAGTQQQSVIVGFYAARAVLIYQVRVNLPVTKAATIKTCTSGFINSGACTRSMYACKQQQQQQQGQQHQRLDTCANSCIFTSVTAAATEASNPLAADNCTAPTLE